jgi:hypothetical protein
MLSIKGGTLIRLLMQYAAIHWQVKLYFSATTNALALHTNIQKGTVNVDRYWNPKLDL